jgi:hypothetical protein
MRGEEDEIEECGAVGENLLPQRTQRNAEEDRKTFNHKGHEETQR